jgi:hypothetical protein
MAVTTKKQPRKSGELESPCGSGCQYFVEKTCPGEDTKCALYWRFSEGLK